MSKMWRHFSRQFYSKFSAERASERVWKRWHWQSYQYELGVSRLLYLEHSVHSHFAWKVWISAACWNNQKSIDIRLTFADRHWHELWLIIGRFVSFIHNLLPSIFSGLDHLVTTMHTICTNKQQLLNTLSDKTTFCLFWPQFYSACKEMATCMIPVNILIALSHATTQNL